MPPYSALLIASSGAVLVFLGSVHLYLTLATDKFLPRDPQLKPRLETVSPLLTNQTSMWKAWIGFNLSHSLGAVLFGVVYADLALFHLSVLLASPFLLLVGGIFLIAFLVVGKLYWFRTPFRGIALALVLYLAGVMLALAHPNLSPLTGKAP